MSALCRGQHHLASRPLAPSVERRMYLIHSVGQYDPEWQSDRGAFWVLLPPSTRDSPALPPVAHRQSIHLPAHSLSVIPLWPSPQRFFWPFTSKCIPATFTAAIRATSPASCVCILIN